MAKISEIPQTEPEGELRLIVGLGGGWVYKFYNGKYRVYEISFRDNTETKEKQ